MIFLTALAVLTGCLSLALSQEQKWRLVTGLPLGARTQTVMRAVAWSCLLAALVALMVSEGAGFGVLICVLQAAVACFLVALVLGFRPGALRLAARLYASI